MLVLVSRLVRHCLCTAARSWQHVHGLSCRREIARDAFVILANMDAIVFFVAAVKWANSARHCLRHAPRVICDTEPDVFTANVVLVAGVSCCALSLILLRLGQPLTPLSAPLRRYVSQILGSQLLYVRRVYPLCPARRQQSRTVPDCRFGNSRHLVVPFVLRPEPGQGLVKPGHS